MKLGFMLPHMMNLKALTQPWELAIDGLQQTELIKWAETLGYEMTQVPEHHVMPNEHVDLSGAFYFNALTAMAHLAGATTRMRVSSCIQLLPLQNPIIVAKALSTMDWLSGGRITINFGVGWLKEEFDVLGVDFHKRGAMAEEYVRAMIELWTSDTPEFEGKFVSFKDVAFEPKPVQKGGIPIWFGGDSDAALKRAGRYGSGWMPSLTPADKLAERLDFIRSQPDYGGKMQDVSYSLSTGAVGEGHVVLESDLARGGKPKQQTIDELGWLAGMGVTWSGVPTPPLTSLEGWKDHVQYVAEEIAPAVAGL
jgi:probable F420-dependent oxidoreductase